MEVFDGALHLSREPGANGVEWLIDWDPASNVCSLISRGMRLMSAWKLDVAELFCFLLPILCVLLSTSPRDWLT